MRMQNALSVGFCPHQELSAGHHCNDGRRGVAPFGIGNQYRLAVFHHGRRGFPRPQVDPYYSGHRFSFLPSLIIRCKMQASCRPP